MRHRIIAAVAVLLFGAPPAHAAGQVERDQVERDQVMRGVAALQGAAQAAIDQGEVPGLSVAIVNVELHGQKLHLTAKEFRLRFPTEFTPSTPQSPFARVSCSPSALRACPPSLSVARDLPAPRDGPPLQKSVQARWREPRASP